MIFPIIFPLLNITFPDDKGFAKALCERIKNAISEFQELYCDELYFIASKFCNRGTPQESWNYRTKTGYTINVGDEIADTYVWLVKNIVLNKSCHFKGSNGATFEAYIKTILNSDYTFKDWLKWKTSDSLIKIPGATGYVPKCIKQLDSTSINVYKLLRQKKSDENICLKLGLEHMDYLTIYDVIEEKLLESNQIHLINEPRIRSAELQNDEDDPEFQLSGNMSTNPAKSPDLEILKSMIDSLLNKIDKKERKILILWATGYSADEIIDELDSKSFYRSNNEKIHFKGSKEIYPFIEKQISNVVKICSKDYPEYYNNQKIDNSRMKRILKTYYNYFD